MTITTSFTGFYFLNNQNVISLSIFQYISIILKIYGSKFYAINLNTYNKNK